MLEGDSTQMPLRIERAEEAILARLRELPQKFLVVSDEAELQLAACPRSRPKEHLKTARESSGVGHRSHDANGVDYTAN